MINKSFYISNINFTELFFLFLVFLSFESCCKDKNPRVEGCQNYEPEDLGFYSVSSIKPYFCFKAGSWWIYECDSTGESDSVVMVSFSLDTIHAESERRFYNYESFSYMLRSTFNQATTRYYNYGSNPDMVDWSFFLIWERARSTNSDYDGVSTMYSTKLDTGKSFGSGCVFTGHLDQIEVLGKMYQDILVFEVAPDPTWPDTKIPTYDYGKSTYYYARDIGLIKIKNLDIDRSKQNQPQIIQSWNLKQKFIIK